ncbi:MAG TPA: bifunctional DNA-formamidopyrimidine glycosylase/DNA-(apurinic or apyrimidinic site) lyase [Candidatus Polarisedimenticolia bacterium]|nr:bifunctional DNA-formamidopyrimidine glycosylase/DNA-(apurinic or apyrimidinic site) lyase [Candidatus Polarisedimenticolia bacterium]
MPELPEVETVARGLQAVLPGRRIVAVRLGKTDFIEDPAAIARELPGCRIRVVRRHGKFLVLDLEPSDGTAASSSLLIHLGMTGQIVVCSAEAPVARHTHAFFSLDDGREMRYTDIRRFGRMRILSDGTQDEVLGRLGFDPLEASEDELRETIRSRRARIKALLLDQHVFRGMGNIYTDESLWRARIHPMRLGAYLKDAELRRLYKAVRAVLTEAIRFRGSSVSDYVDSEGRRGEFQQRHRVYQREGKKCFRCGALIRRAIVAGRSSYFCPRCQPPPRIQRRTPRK